MWLYLYRLPGDKSALIHFCYLWDKVHVLTLIFICINLLWLLLYHIRSKKRTISHFPWTKVDLEKKQHVSCISHDSSQLLDPDYIKLSGSECLVMKFLFSHWLSTVCCVFSCFLLVYMILSFCHVDIPWKFIVEIPKSDKCALTQDMCM